MVRIVVVSTCERTSFVAEVHISLTVHAALAVDAGGDAVKRGVTSKAGVAAGLGVAVTLAGDIVSVGALVITAVAGDGAISGGAAGYRIRHRFADETVVSTVALVVIAITMPVRTFVESGIANLNACFILAEGAAIVGYKTVLAAFAAIVHIIHAITLTIGAGVISGGAVGDTDATDTVGFPVGNDRTGEALHTTEGNTIIPVTVAVRAGMVIVVTVHHAYVVQTGRITADGNRTADALRTAGLDIVVGLAFAVRAHVIAVVTEGMTGAVAKRVTVLRYITSRTILAAMADVVVRIALPVAAEMESGVALSPAASVTDGDSVDRCGACVAFLAAVCDIVGGITVLIMAKMGARIAGFATYAIRALGISAARRSALAARTTAVGDIGVRVTMPVIAKVVEGITEFAAGSAQT